jgi:hypothetical protein
VVNYTHGPQKKKAINISVDSLYLCPASGKHISQKLARRLTFALWILADKMILSTLAAV